VVHQIDGDVVGYQLLQQANKQRNRQLLSIHHLQKQATSEQDKMLTLLKALLLVFGQRKSQLFHFKGWEFPLLIHRG
jgi:hypothetical protein